MSASQHSPDQRPPEAGPGSRTPPADAFEAGRDRGATDGADWARHRAIARDLRQLCDPRDGDPVAVEEVLALLQRYRTDPRCLAVAGGHDAESYREGYGVGFQRGACAVWNTLRELADELDRLL